MCVLLKWLAVDPLSTVRGEGPQQLGHNTWGEDNQIMDREKWKNNEREIKKKKIVWLLRKASVVMRTVLRFSKTRLQAQCALLNIFCE